MPQEVAARTYDSHRSLYQPVCGDRRPTERLPIRADVLVMTGCQHNQLTTEGPRNGLFTNTLVAVWQCGRFRGSYREFHRAV